MKLRGYVVWIILLGLIAYGLSSMWKFRYLLRQNLVRYELNQNKLSAAKKQLDDVRFESTEKWDDLRLEYLVRNGDLKQAQEFAPGGGRAKFWAAVSAFLQYQESDAIELLANDIDSALVTDEERLAHDWVRAALFGVAPPKSHFGVKNKVLEAAIFLSRGRIRDQNGHHQTAAQDLYRAWILVGDIPELSMDTAMSAVLAGDYYLAQGVLDLEEHTTSVYSALQDKLLVSRIEDDFKVSNLTSSPYENNIRRLRGAAWSDLQLQRLAANDDATSEQITLGLSLHPDDPVLRTFAAEWGERTGRYEQSFRDYLVAAGSGSLDVCLKLQSLIAGRTVDVNDCITSLSDRLIQRFTFKGTGQSTYYPRIQGGETIRTVLEVAETGAYELVLVAEADHFDGIGPMVDVMLDGVWAGRWYLGREGIESYSLDLELGKGIHPLELRYLNDYSVPGSTEGRNFYFGTLLVLKSDINRDGIE